MGWSSKNGIMWGDTTQDLVDDYLDELVGKKFERSPLYFTGEKEKYRSRVKERV